MGTSTSTAQLVGKIDRYAKSFGKANRAGVSAAALRYKEQALRNLDADTGGDRRMSNFRSGRVKMGAGYRLYGYEDAKAVLKPRPYGVWALLDGGSAPHRIAPKGRGRRVADRRKALKFGTGYAAYADHPGSTGKRTFRNVPRQAEPAAKRSFQRSHHQALLDVFK